MTAYTTIANTEIDAESPVTEELMTRLRDNPIAMAEGAAGSPRVVGRALNTWEFDLTADSTGTSVINLDLVSKIKIDFCAAGGTGNLEFRYSNNNGSSYGSYQTVFGISSPAAVGSFYIDLQDGTYAVRGIQVDSSTQSVINSSGTHTVPSNCNAISFRSSSAGTAFYLTGWILGGIV